MSQHPPKPKGVESLVPKSGRDWNPADAKARGRYGSKGFGATGHGTGEEAGLGAFDVGQVKPSPKSKTDK